MQAKQMLIQELWLVLTQTHVCLQGGSIWFVSVDKGKTGGCPLCETFQMISLLKSIRQYPGADFPLTSDAMRPRLCLWIPD